MTSSIQWHLLNKRISKASFDSMINSWYCWLLGCCKVRWMEYEVIARGEFSRVRVQVVGGRSSRYIWVYYTMRNFKNVYRDNSCELWKILGIPWECMQVLGKNRRTNNLEYLSLWAFLTLRRKEQLPDIINIIFPESAFSVRDSKLLKIIMSSIHSAEIIDKPPGASAHSILLLCPQIGEV